MKNDKAKLKIMFGQRGNLGWVVGVFVAVLATGYFLAVAPAANAAIPCSGEYTSCNIDYGGVKKGICLASLCGSTDISLNLKSKYDATKKYCADSATKNECITPTVNPEVDGYGNLIGFSCAAKAVNTACTISACAQNPLGVPYSGCTNAAEKCQFYAGSIYYPTYPSCVANTACPDADRDGIPLCWAPGQYTKWDTPVPPPKKDPSRFSDDSGIGDCDDKDPYSYGYSSANIASVSVVDVGGVKRNIPVGNFSPVDTITLTVNFKKKCGHTTPTPPAVPLYVSLVFSPTEEFTLSGGSPTSFARKSDFVYTADIWLNGILSEKLIAAITKNSKPKLKFLGADEFTPTSQDMSFNSPTLPMTNCAQTSGSGPLKVVYMRDQTGKYEDTMNHSTVALGGFWNVEPLKKYKSQFSHFIDLSKPNIYFKDVSISGLSFVRTKSSCGRFNWMYFGIFTDPTQDPFGNGWTMKGTHAAIIQWGGSDKVESYKYIHELGHSVAGLADEYIRYYNKSVDWYSAIDVGQFKPHCTLNPKSDYTVGGVSYGGAFEGCTVGTIEPTTKPIFRPSRTSIMMGGRALFIENPEPNSFRLNVISCARFLGEIKDVTWTTQLAECVAMTKTSPPGVIPVGQ